MVLVDFAATTATPVICAGSEAAGTVFVAVDHVLDMASEVAMVLGLLMLRPNRPCRRRRRSRPGFLPDRPLQTCTRTMYWSPRTTQWTSTLSRNLRLLHHRVRARCMVGGHGWSCRLQPPPPQDYEVQEEAELAPPVPLAEPAQPDSPRLPSPTPAHEAAGAGASSSSASLGLRLPARAAVLGDVFVNWASSSTGPSAPRRWDIVPRAELQRSRAVVLGLANGHSNAAAPGTDLPGGSSSEEEVAPGASNSRR
uniref:Uncharacterized protein n=1 Tax=Triticum urartu TaxID=4572 RepID=A0A8R7Q6U9_TRIUA